eukprot:GFUD01040036.1.p1 GENE.GFUD01040036.1~~GFUD01040036.1.p1  ORF type:complete len:339 (+),score=123.75 GFUD01040036.1:282-1298(+)
MEEVKAEISGPVLAALHHRFAESRADFLAILLGCVSVQNYSENSDLATQTEKSKLRVVVQDLVIVSMEMMMDFKARELNKEYLQSLVEGKSGFKFVGVLKFKKAMKVNLSPTFHDRQVMAAVLASCSWKDPKPRLYMLVGEEVTTTTLSIKYSMTTFLLEHKKECVQGPWSRKMPLVVPNLGTDQRVEYMQGGGGGSRALKEMVEGVGIVESCVVDVDKNFKPISVRFKAGMDLGCDRVIELSESKAALEEEVMKLEQKLSDKLELSREMLMIRGLQGDLKTALEVAWSCYEDELGNKNKGSPDMFDEKININGSMEKLELSGEVEEEDASGVSNQSY